MKIPFTVHRPLMPGEYVLNVDLKKNAFNIRNVIFNDPATIVIWDDGTKTVVKCANEAFDPEKGLAMAIAKKVFGNEGNYYNLFRKFLPEKKEEPAPDPEAERFATNYERAIKNLSNSLRKFGFGK